MNKLYLSHKIYQISSGPSFDTKHTYLLQLTPSDLVGGQGQDDSFHNVNEVLFSLSSHQDLQFDTKYDYIHRLTLFDPI